MSDKTKRLAASIQQRLLNIARDKHEDTNFVRVRYAIERLLYRLSQSKHADRFLLKGAMLFAVWSNQPYRPTKDVDLMGYDDSDVLTLISIFKDICATQVEPDGLVFDGEPIAGEYIRNKHAHGGVRVKLTAG